MWKATTSVLYIFNIYFSSRCSFNFSFETLLWNTDAGFHAAICPLDASSHRFCARVYVCVYLWQVLVRTTQKDEWGNNNDSRRCFSKSPTTTPPTMEMHVQKGRIISGSFYILCGDASSLLYMWCYSLAQRYTVIGGTWTLIGVLHLFFKGL